MRGTGDLVEYTDEGGLVCLGRHDNQVKRHGKRITLSQIQQVYKHLTKRKVALLQGPITCISNMPFVLQLRHFSKGLCNLQHEGNILYASYWPLNQCDLSFCEVCITRYLYTELKKKLITNLFGICSVLYQSLRVGIMLMKVYIFGEDTVSDLL